MSGTILLKTAAGVVYACGISLSLGSKAWARKASIFVSNRQGPYLICVQISDCFFIPGCCYLVALKEPTSYLSANKHYSSYRTFIYMCSRSSKTLDGQEWSAFGNCCRLWTETASGCVLVVCLFICVLPLQQFTGKKGCGCVLMVTDWSCAIC